MSRIEHKEHMDLHKKYRELCEEGEKIISTIQERNDNTMDAVDNARFLYEEISKHILQIQIETKVDSLSDSTKKERANMIKTLEVLNSEMSREYKNILPYCAEAQGRYSADYTNTRIFIEG